MKLHSLYEDNHLLIVNKPAGLLVQGDETGDETLADLAKEYIKVKYEKPGAVFLGVVHRIDRPVSGVVVLARTSKGLERMNALFRDRKIEKTYWAITSNKPPLTQDTLVHWIKKNRKTNRVTATSKKGSDSQRAELNYQLLGRIGNYYLLKVNPLTGRPHQIRVQLAKIGCPILWDVKYGSQEKSRDGSIHLHARSIQFEHPVKKEPLRVTAAVPKEQIWQLFKDITE